MKINEEFKKQFTKYKTEEMSIQEYLELCKKDNSAYINAPERMLKAIGEPKKVDTSKVPRLSRVFSNRIIDVYDVFSDFYGMEDVIANVVSYFKHAAQGLEERKQILYLLGPVGGGKSTLAERLKSLMETQPIYALKGSPIQESPLGLFSGELAEQISAKYNIPARYLTNIPSPWALKRLDEYEGDLSKFVVQKIYPNQLKQIAIAKTEPGDENTQDISALVGKTDIRQLEFFPQNDVDSYSFSGGLCKANRGILDFVEMFKAPIKMLHPLLTATQEGNYNATEGISAIPFDGIVLAHCFSEDTEILTQDGWKYHNEISIGDSLATLNTEKDVIEYQPALDKFIYDFQGDAYHFSNNAADHIVTGNHGMVCKTQYTDNWRKILAEDVKDTGSIMPVSGKVTLPDYDISDEELRLQVWLTADGHISYEAKNHLYIRFHLRKPRKVERLECLLLDADIEYKSTYNVSDDSFSITFNLSKEYSKRLPDYFTYLSLRQRRLVINEYAHTDGTIMESGHIQLSSDNKTDIDLLQHLAVTSGYKANLCSHTKGRYSPQYFLSLSEKTEHRMDYAKETVYYKGKVFCFETPNHTLIARRNGKVLITYNSNQSEWDSFKSNKNNEAFLDRVYLVKVPYCLRYQEESQIYDKLIRNSDLKNAPCAPKTLELLAQFAVMTRLEDTSGSQFTKMRVYNGDVLKGEDPTAKSYLEYKESIDSEEGMDGISTRFAFKLLAKVYNYQPYNHTEIEANPVHLFTLLTKAVKDEGGQSEDYISWITEYLQEKYYNYLENDIKGALLGSSDEYGQNMYERYVRFADLWLQDQDYRDAHTGEIYDREALNEELEEIEKAAGIANPKDTRHEIVNFYLRYKADNNGKVPKWTFDPKMKEAIQAKIFSDLDDKIPVITLDPRVNNTEKKEQEEYIDHMKAKGYTRTQAQIVSEWLVRWRKSK